MFNIAHSDTCRTGSCIPRFRTLTRAFFPFFSCPLSGKSGTRAKRRLRDGDDVREPVRRGNQGPVGGRRYTRVL